MASSDLPAIVEILGFEVFGEEHDGVNHGFSVKLSNGDLDDVQANDPRLPRELFDEFLTSSVKKDWKSWANKVPTEYELSPNRLKDECIKKVLQWFDEEQGSVSSFKEGGQGCVSLPDTTAIPVLLEELINGKKIWMPFIAFVSQSVNLDQTRDIALALYTEVGFETDGTDFVYYGHPIANWQCSVRNGNIACVTNNQTDEAERAHVVFPYQIRKVVSLSPICIVEVQGGNQIPVDPSFIHRPDFFHIDGDRDEPYLFTDLTGRTSYQEEYPRLRNLWEECANSQANHGHAPGSNKPGLIDTAVNTDGLTTPQGTALFEQQEPPAAAAKPTASPEPHQSVEKNNPNMSEVHEQANKPNVIDLCGSESDDDNDATDNDATNNASPSSSPSSHTTKGDLTSPDGSDNSYAPPSNPVVEPVPFTNSHSMGAPIGDEFVDDLLGGPGHLVGGKRPDSPRCSPTPLTMDFDKSPEVHLAENLSRDRSYEPHGNQSPPGRRTPYDDLNDFADQSNPNSPRPHHPSATRPGIHKVENKLVPTPHGSPKTPPSQPEHLVDNVQKAAEGGNPKARKALNDIAHAIGRSPIFSASDFHNAAEMKAAQEATNPVQPEDMALDDMSSTQQAITYVSNVSRKRKDREEFNAAHAARTRPILPTHIFDFGTPTKLPRKEVGDMSSTELKERFDAVEENKDLFQRALHESEEEAARLKKEVDERNVKQEAATKIQVVARMRMARRWRQHLADERKAAELAATKIQVVARMRMARKLRQQLAAELAATKIQAIARMQMACMSYQNNLPAWKEMQAAIKLANEAEQAAEEAASRAKRLRQEADRAASMCNKLKGA